MHEDLQRSHTRVYLDDELTGRTSAEGNSEQVNR